MATPGEPYPLNNPPFPNGTVSQPLAERVFSYMFFTANGAGSVFTSTPDHLAHAAHPNFWDPGRSRQNHKTVLRSPTATESQKWSRTLALAAQVDVKS